MSEPGKNRNVSISQRILKILVFFAFIFFLEAIWIEHQNYVQNVEAQPNPYVGVATRGFRRAMKYHGIKSAYWDYEKGTWVFERDGQVCLLKTMPKREVLHRLHQKPSKVVPANNQ